MLGIIEKLWLLRDDVVQTANTMAVKSANLPVMEYDHGALLGVERIYEFLHHNISVFKGFLVANISIFSYI